MDISVIIPYGGYPKYLLDCLDSLLEQKISLEAILVNSTDQILPSFIVNYPFVKVIEINQNNVGLKRNIGIKNSIGKYLYFLDDDDYIFPSVLDDMLALANQYEIVVGRRMFSWFKREVFFAMSDEKNEENNNKDSNRDRFSRLNGCLAPTKDALYELLIKSRYGLNNISCLNILIPREIIINKNILFNEKNIFYPDLEFVVKLIDNINNFAYLDHCVYIKRNHNDPINQPSLHQISDHEYKFDHFLKAYQDARSLTNNLMIINSLDLKLIKYYTNYFAKKLRRSNDSTWKNERFIKITNIIKNIPEDIYQSLNAYESKMVKYARKANLKATLRVISIHLGLLKVKKILKNRNELYKYLYYNKYRKQKVVDNLIVFETFMGKSYADSPKYIYEFLAKNYPGKFKFVWVLNDLNTKLPYPGIKIKRFSKDYAKYLGIAKYFVFNVRQPLWFRKRDEQIFLETWHGTPLKRLVFDQDEVTAASPKYKQQFFRQKQEWDYLIAANQFSSDIFKSCFLYDGNMLVTGYPRNDILSDSNRNNLAINLKQKLGIPLNKKTILYAPTWRDDEYYGKGQYKFKLKLDLDLLYKELGDEYVILLRTHHYIADNLDVNGLEDFAYNVSKYDDISEIYLISDICITDYSSVFFDYANLRRPILFYPYDIEKYRAILRGFYIDMETDLPGPLLYSSQEIVDAIKNINTVTLNYKEKYNQFYERFCLLDDGNASEKVCNIVFGLGENND